jgi:5,10-methenyltetrahydrofolate synthetase
MPHDRDDDSLNDYASPACFLHEVEAPVQPMGRRLPPEDVALWRKGERERLIGERLAITIAARKRWNAGIAAGLLKVIGDPAGAVISAYWPFRGEPDLLPLFPELMAKGARMALPVVVRKGQPLLFRVWKRGDRLERGVWNIPYPADGEIVRPDIVIAPVVGFDEGHYRLGYGGGFYDRTLAGLGTAARPIGVGYSLQRIPTIHPQPYDIPMQAVVTENGLLEPQPVDPPEDTGMPEAA